MVKNADGYNVGGFVNLGACAMAKNDLDQAKAHFMNALECDPSHFEALYNLGTVLLSFPNIKLHYHKQHLFT